MARERMVTRTIEATEVTVLCLDTETAEPCNKTVAISATFKDEKAMLKAVRKEVETDTLKAVKIVATKTTKALYKMPEAQFIASAIREEIAE